MRPGTEYDRGGNEAQVRLEAYHVGGARVEGREDEARNSLRAAGVELREVLDGLRAVQNDLLEAKEELHSAQSKLQMVRDKLLRLRASCGGLEKSCVWLETSCVIKQGC